MRKKLFAILMSATMVASFMPSMAFAGIASAPTKTDDLDTGVDGHTFSITSETTTNAAVKALKDADATKDEVVAFTPATCTKDGSVTLKCNKEKENELCTATKTIVVKGGHDFGTTENPNKKRLSVEAYAKAMQAVKAPGFLNDAQVATKIADYNKTYCYVEAPVCKLCGAIDKEHAAIATVGTQHTRPDEKTQGLDCKTTTKCVNCGKELKKDKTPAKHSFQDASGIKADATPTSEKKLCGDVIEKTYTCTTCGETEKTYTKDGKTAAPTCKIFKNQISVAVSADKLTLYKAGTSKVVATRAKADDGWTAAAGYKVSEIYADTVYEADTTVKEDDGKTYYAFTCNECGYVTVTNVEKTDAATAEHKHVWKKVTSEPTCKEDGYEAAYCEGCGLYAKKDALTVKNYDDTTSDKLDSTVGTKIADAVGHKLNVVKKDATCKVPGHYEISCSVCGDKYGKGAGECTYVEFEKDSSKTPAPLYLNTKTGKVKANGDYGDMKLDYIDPAVKGHSFSKKVVLKEATCTVNELSGFKCDTCGKIDVHHVTETAGSALGHKAEKVNVEAATCEKDGSYNVQCSACKKYAVDKDKTEWTKDLDRAYLFENGKKLGGKCDFTKWVVEKDSTVFEEGIKHLECTKCGAANAGKFPIEKKTVAKASVTLKAGKNRFTVKASAANATGYKVVYKRAGKKAITKVVDAENLSKTYTKLAKGKKYTVKVTAFASNGTDTVYGATTTKTVKTK